MGVSNSNFDRIYYKGFDECLTIDKSGTLDCGYYLREISAHDRAIRNYFLIGIMLPVIFYGGGRLINYLFPRKAEQKSGKGK